nr:MAK10-like protein [Tanacetum cinerariifolium]
MGDKNHIRTLGDYSRPSHEGYQNTIELLDGNNVVPLTIDQSTGGKLCDKNAIESWALLEDLALYDNKSSNDPRDFPKPVKEIFLPQDVPSTSDRRLIELENQVQCLMEAYLAPNSFVQVNKIASSCKICSAPHDIQCCMENPEQAFVDYASSRDKEVGGNSETVIKETKSQDLEQNNLGDRACRNTKEVEEAEEWMEYEEPLDLVETHDKAFDLKSGFYMDADKLDPSYKEETDRINIDGSYLMRRSPEVLRSFMWMIFG